MKKGWYNIRHAFMAWNYTQQRYFPFLRPVYKFILNKISLLFYHFFLFYMFVSIYTQSYDNSSLHVTSL